MTVDDLSMGKINIKQEDNQSKFMLCNLQKSEREKQFWFSSKLILFKKIDLFTEKNSVFAVHLNFFAHFFSLLAK